MPNVTITQLPAAGPITGSELVPVVQNGQTVRTTASALAGSPVQTQTFITLNQEPTLPNSRALSGGTGIGLVDGGALSTLQIVLNGASASLETVSTGVLVKTGATTIANRTLTASGAGLSVTNGDGVAGNPTFALSGLAASLANLGGVGFVGLSAIGTATALDLLGTANQITVTGGDATAGNPVFGLANNTVIPGSEGVQVPGGTTAQRGSGVNGKLRYNSDTGTFEGYANGAWGAITTGSGVTSIATGLGLTGGPITSTGTISIDTTVVATLTDSQTLTNKTISGSNNTFSNIGNSALSNSAVTINGTSVSLGGSATITAAAPNALTIGTGLSGTSYNGSAAVTIAISDTGVTANTYGSASAVPVFAVNAQGQITSVTNTSISIASSAITDKGLANGVASLDGSGTVPTSQLPAAVLGALKYQGAWDAATNSPTLTSSVGTQGYYYVVSVAGSTNLNGITDWKIGDWAIFNGSIWQKIDNTDAVTSVNGYTGTVVLAYSDVGAPSTSGTGATGTWGISISGDAANVTGVVAAANGGTGISSYSTGDLIYASGATTISKLNLGTQGYALIAGPSGPTWSGISGGTF